MSDESRSTPLEPFRDNPARARRRRDAELRLRLRSAIERRSLSLDAIAGRLGINVRSLRRAMTPEAHGRFDVAMFETIADMVARSDRHAFIAEILGSTAPDLGCCVYSHSGETISMRGTIFDAMGQIDEGLALAARSARADPVEMLIASTGCVVRDGKHFYFSLDSVAHAALQAAVRDVHDNFAPRAEIVVNGTPMPVILAKRALQREAMRALLRDSDIPWREDRLPLNAIASDRLAVFLDQARQNPRDLYDWVMGVPSFRETSAIFSVRNDDVVSIYAGEKLGVDRHAVVGRNVLDRPEPLYGEMLQRHVQEAVRSNEPVLRAMDIVLPGRRGRYQRVSVVGPVHTDGTRFVINLIDGLELLPVPAAIASAPSLSSR